MPPEAPRIPRALRRRRSLSTTPTTNGTTMRAPHRLATAATATAILGAAVAGPLLIASDGAQAHEAEGGCEVTAASLSWGVKESFRSYIGSSIANGSWEVANGATYETPSFGWSTATGSIDPATGHGQVAFTGSIVFSGHDGLLHLVLADPIIHLGDDGATLLLDVLSNDATGALAVDEQDVVFATLPIDVAGTDWQPGATVDLPALAPVVLSETGAAAFGGFYAAGDELDPITLSVTLGDECGAAAAETPVPTVEPTPAPDEVVDESAAAPSTGVIAGIVAAAVLVAGGAAAAIVAIRRRGR